MECYGRTFLFISILIDNIYLINNTSISKMSSDFGMMPLMLLENHFN